jgi:hypothetical protein
MNKKGYVYILTNDSFKEDYIKIGITERDPYSRARDLSGTGVPTPFDVYAYIKTEKYKETEKLVHHIIDLISDKRVNKKREFFQINKKVAYEILEDIKLFIGDEAELELAEEIEIKDSGITRSSVFTFAKKGILPGTKIQFKGDRTIEAEVYNVSKVKFENQIYSLSALAKELYIRLNKVRDSGAYSGPRHFLLNGVRLSDLENVVVEV